MSFSQGKLYKVKSKHLKKGYVAFEGEKYIAFHDVQEDNPLGLTWAKYYFLEHPEKIITTTTHNIYSLYWIEGIDEEYERL